MPAARREMHGPSKTGNEKLSIKQKLVRADCQPPCSVFFAEQVAVSSERQADTERYDVLRTTSVSPDMIAQFPSETAVSSPVSCPSTNVPSVDAIVRTTYR